MRSWPTNGWIPTRVMQVRKGLKHMPYGWICEPIKISAAIVLEWGPRIDPPTQEDAK